MTINLTVEGMVLFFVAGTIGSVAGRLIADKIQRWLDARQRREMRRGK